MGRASLEPWKETELKDPHALLKVGGCCCVQAAGGGGGDTCNTAPRVVGVLTRETGAGQACGMLVTLPKPGWASAGITPVINRTAPAPSGWQGGIVWSQQALPRARLHGQCALSAPHAQQGCTWVPAAACPGSHKSSDMEPGALHRSPFQISGASGQFLHHKPPSFSTKSLALTLQGVWLTVRRKKEQEKYQRKPKNCNYFMEKSHRIQKWSLNFIERVPQKL